MISFITINPSCLVCVDLCLFRSIVANRDSSAFIIISGTNNWYQSEVLHDSDLISISDSLFSEFYNRYQISVISGTIVVNETVVINETVIISVPHLSLMLVHSVVGVSPIRRCQC